MNTLKEKHADKNDKSRYSSVVPELMKQISNDEINDG